MSYRVLFLGLMAGLLVCSLAFADIPKTINFQGRLTDATGKFVPDGNYSLTFRIYTDSTGGSAKWSEGQLVAVSKGLFNVILGSANPIPDSIFNNLNTYLGIQVGADPEMSPRQRLSSLGYAYRGAKADTSNYSKDSDKLDGLHASDFSSPATDYGRSGVATDLYEGTSTLTSKYVNEGQSNSVTSGMITNGEIVDADISASANISASKLNDGSGSGLDADLLDGQNSSAFLSTSSDYGRTGVATDLYEGASTLTSKYVNEGQANSISSGMITDNEISNADISASANISPSKISGTAWTSTNDGTSSGLDADLLDGQQGSYYTNASNLTTGTLADARLSPNVALLNNAQTFSGLKAFNPSSGSVPFTVDATKNSTVTNLNADLLDGQHSSAFVSTGTDYGRSGVATDLYEGANTLTSKYVNTIGPDSVVSTSGTAFKGRVSGSSTSSMYGFQGYADNSSTGPSYGVYSTGLNSSTGQAFGGYFTTWPVTGSGYRYGVYSQGAGSSSYPTYAYYGDASNSGSGDAYGGFFITSSSGTGIHYGVKADCYSASSANTYGAYGKASNSSNSNTYGGYFTADSLGIGNHYGIHAISYGNGGGYTWGSQSIAYNLSPSSTGDVFAGDFYTNSYGTGQAFGVAAVCYGNGGPSKSTYGSYIHAGNSSNGNAYGGHFSTRDWGTGTHYGIWSEGHGASAAPVYGSYNFVKNTSSGNVYGGYFVADSIGSGIEYGIWAQASVVYWAGWFQGDLGVSRNLYVYGTKSAAVKVDNDEYRAMYAQESPEVLFEDFGDGELVNGKAVVNLDPLFIQMANTQIKYRVYLTPEGDCKGLYVTNKTANSFEVRELQGGMSNITFNYRIVAKRKGYEEVRLAKVKGPTPEEMAVEQAKNQAEFEKERAQREEEHKRMEQQRLEMESKK